MNGFPKLSTEEDLYESRNTVNKRKHAHSGEEQMKVRVDRYTEKKKIHAQVKKTWKLLYNDPKHPEQTFPLFLRHTK